MTDLAACELDVIITDNMYTYKGIESLLKSYSFLFCTLLSEK